MKLCADDLRHSVAIEQRAETKDELGGRVTVWSVFATVWAKIEPTSGREGRNAAKMQATVTHKITLRYYAGITPKMRVRFGTRTFDIHSVLDIEERNVIMVLSCEEGSGT